MLSEHGVCQDWPIPTSASKTKARWSASPTVVATKATLLGGPFSVRLAGVVNPLLPFQQHPIPTHSKLSADVARAPVTVNATQLVGAFVYESTASAGLWLRLAALSERKFQSEMSTVTQPSSQEDK